MEKDPVTQRSLEYVVDGLVNDTHGRIDRDEIAKVVDEAYEEIAAQASLISYIPILTQRHAREMIEARHLDTVDPPSDFTRVLVCGPTNSGRTQCAAALMRFYAPGHVKVVSAGDVAAGEIKPVVNRYLRERGVQLTDYPKQIRPEFLNAADHVVVLGGGADELNIPAGKDVEVWDGSRLADLNDDDSRAAIRDIDLKVRAFLERVLPGVELPPTVFNH
ncbi:MAG: hypothetical protein KDC39_05325 [Actinobacteria bacterium]|nr:hypothetical protein [Actinomycetota bacterium]